MALGDFMRRTAVVYHGGRRFVCRRPSLRAVLLALDLYADAIGALLTLERDESATEIDKRALAGALAEQYPERAAQVLALCVEDQVHTAEVPALAAAVLGLCDLDRIISGLNLADYSSGAEPEAPAPGPSGLEREMVRLAERFGTTPEAVMDWPVEMILGIRDVDNANDNAAIAAGSGHSAQFMAAVQQMAAAYEKDRPRG